MMEQYDQASIASGHDQDSREEAECGVSESIGCALHNGSGKEGHNGGGRSLLCTTIGCSSEYRGGGDEGG